MQTQSRRSLWTAIALLAIMMLTRGSHVGDSSMLPDATLAVMLLGGMLLQQASRFALLMAAAVIVDAWAVGFAGISSYCLSPAYWALLPTYGAMWLGGRWLATRRDAFAMLPYAAVATLTASVAFVISTHSFYVFSGKFPEAPLWQVLQHGWEYYPAYVGYTLMYLALGWLAQRASRGLIAVPQLQTR